MKSVLSGLPSPCEAKKTIPISPDAGVRAAQGVAEHEDWLSIAVRPPRAQTHLVGPYHSALGVFQRGQGPTDDEWKWGVESMQQVAEFAEQVNVMLGVEYLNRFETYLLNCAADTARFCKDVDRPNCKMMYDTFHANIEEKNIPADAIRTACADQTVPRSHLVRMIAPHRVKATNPLGRQRLTTLEGGRLRRLDDDRGVRSRLARTCRRDKDLATDVPKRRPTCPRRSGVHEVGSR